MRRGVGTAFLLFAIVVSLLSIAPSVSADLPEDIGGGPFIDNIVYKVLPDSNQRRLALLAGEIEMDANYYDPYYTAPSSLESLDTDPDIDIAQTLKNGYTYASFDCEQYPVNISGFRRAFAYAFDKTRVVNEVMNRYAQVHDSVVPYQNQFCIEDELDYHYYDSQPDLGNAILDDLGFAINPNTGFRDAPNGDPMHILILYGMGLEKLGDIADVCIEAFTSLDISASSTAPCNCELNEEMTIWGEQFYDSDLSWLANYYWSGYTDDYHVTTGFSNATFDSWRDQLLYSNLYEDTFEAASEMQKILHYNVPLIPIYQDIRLHPYRTDKFQGHIEDSVNSICGPWTSLNIRRLDSASGGTVPVGIYDESNFNFWMVRATSGHWFFTNLHYALYTRDPDQQPYAQLAESVTIETHTDNPSIIEGNTRFTFEIKEGIEWTDGVPVTSDDVLFTFNYILDSSDFGNPAGYSLTDLFSLYSPRPGAVVLEFSTESYWLFERFAYNFIVPKHVFETYQPEEWADWGLITNNEGESLNCGPFMLTDYEEGEFYEFTSRYIEEPDDWTGITRIYVAKLNPSGNIRIYSRNITLQWEIQWEFLSAASYISGEGRFELLDECVIVESFSYTVLLDGELYGETHYGGYGTENRIEVNISESVLPPGNHNVTIIFDNHRYPVQVDTIIVTVMSPFPFLTSIVVISASIIAITSLAIIWHVRLRRSQPQLSGL